MTIKAQLRKTALGLPDTQEDEGRAHLSYSVRGKVLAELRPGGLLHLKLDDRTLEESLRHCTITRIPAPDGGPAEVAVPLAEINGMELNNLLFKSWLSQAPAELAEAAREAMRGEAPAGPDALPANIGKPAMRALLLAGITTLEQVATRTESELLGLHGVGPRAVRVLSEALKASGRQLAR